MQRLSVNQIFKALGHDRAVFKAWLDNEKKLYQESHEAKVYDFDSWLNMKYEGKNIQYIKNMNNSKKAATKINMTADEILELARKGVDTADKIIYGEKEYPKPTTPPITPNSVEKTIIGLKPIVFYPVAIAVGIGAIYGIYRAYKAFKK